MRFAIVHNIPSPYRLHLFETMRSVLQESGAELEVHFLAKGHHDRRHWAQVPTGPSFRYWRDYGREVSGKDWHLNPGLVAHLWANPPDILMVGGPWDSLTCMAVSAVARRTRAIAWIEGNTRTPGRIDGLSRALKARLLSNFRLIAVPGLEGEKYARLILRDRQIPIGYLPNIVDERIFQKAASDRESAERRLGIEPDARLALLPARLVEAKGLAGFLELLELPEPTNWQVRIIGDGPLQEELQGIIERRGLERRVRILPSLSYERMPELYHRASLFVLASRQDPNPLSVVEALHSGLPLLLSTRVGNYPEAAKSGWNAWSFDPDNREEMMRAAQEAFGAKDETLAEMGRHSRTLAAEHWDSVRCVRRFLEYVRSAIG